ncbi:glycosyltransferase family 2 protein [Gemmatimonadota bacterium]
MKVSLVIPVHNERSTIGKIIDQVNQLPFEKEIIVVDDGSTDGTVEVLKQKEDEVTEIHLSPVNFGKGAAVRTGLTYVTGDVVMIQGSHIEHDPWKFLPLLEEIKKGADVVYGSRFLQPNPRITLIKRLANIFLTSLTNLLFGGKLTDMQTAYKMFRTDAARRLSLRSIGSEFETEITSQFLYLGYKIVEVPVTYDPRPEDMDRKIRWYDGLRAVYGLLYHRSILRTRFYPLKNKKSS